MNGPGHDEAAWRSAAARVLRDAEIESLVWRTLDGMAVEPLYPAAAEPVAFTGRSARRWHIAQRIDHPHPAEANLQALADLEGGADVLTLVAADAPSARGFGLRVQTAEDLEAVLANVSLDLIELRLDPGAPGFELAALAADVAERRGHGLADLDLDLGIDPVGTLATAGALPADWPRMAGRMANMLDGLRTRGFAGRAFRADGRPWSDAGASEAQELAAVLGSAVLYLRALEAGGLPLDLARNALSFTLGADTDLTLTVAKFRALRPLWARIEEACGLEPRPIRLHAETAWRTLAATSSHTNIIRAAVACFAAAVGGADGITVLPFTLPLGLPDAFARRLARNTQHVLADESSLGRVDDPASGAGLFETLTQGLCEKAWAMFREIEREGGIAASLAAGEIQSRVAAVRDQRRARLEDGRDALVGATMFMQDDEIPPAVLLPAPPYIASLAVGPLRAEPLPSRRAAEDFENRVGGSSRHQIPLPEPAHPRRVEGQGIELPPSSLDTAPPDPAQDQG